MRRSLGVIIAVTLVGLAGCGAPTHSPTVADRTGDGPATGETPTAGPETDVLGWENGYWYDEALRIDAADGLNETELGAIVNRSMARIEYIRRVEFDRVVPVEIISRATYRERVTTDAGGGATNPTVRRFKNVRFEALFLVGEGGRAEASQENTTATSVQGFYSPATDRITIVSGTESPLISETTLAHELVHALQWGHYDMTGFGGATLEASNTASAVVEGVASYVERLYDRRCGDTWNCVFPPSPSGTGNASDGGDGGGVHMGLYLLRYFPYSDGPAFVDWIRAHGGWDAVADLYARPPKSTEQVIDPAKYRDDAPTEVRIRDRSDGEWRRIAPTYGPPYAAFGQPGITAMFAYPAYDDRSGLVVPPGAFLNVENGSVSRTDPIQYDIPPADGWDGDKLFVYARAGETGYVWRLVWDTPADATEFAEAYRRLLRYWGGEPRQGPVWRIPDTASSFADAFAIHVESATVTIVNAPTIGQLDDVHAPVEAWRSGEAGQRHA